MPTKRTRFTQILGPSHFKKEKGGYITYASSSGENVTARRKTEKQAFQDASGAVPLEPAPPLLDIPDIYTNGKKCSRCRKLRKPSDFRFQQRRGKVYLQSWCKHCEAEWKYLQRHGLVDGRSVP